MNKKLRYKFFEKLAQEVDLPTDQVVKSMPISEPPPFKASDVYPNIFSGWSQQSVSIINNIVDLLNSAAHYSSGGKINFQEFRNNNFTFDASAAGSVDQKNIMNLSQKVFKSLLNSGLKFARILDEKQVEVLINNILFSQELGALSSVNPTGPLASKIHGNLKTLLVNNLNSLKLIN